MAGRQRYWLSGGFLALFMSILDWITLCLAAPGDCRGDLDDLGSRHQRGVHPPQTARGKKASLVISCEFSMAFQCCGKERAASERCQATLLQLTCAANVEPSDPDLDGNHCKYFPVRLVEDSFNGASHRGN